MRTTSWFAFALLLTGLAAPFAARAQQMPALPAGVRLVLSRCDGIVDRKSLLEQLRIELLSIGVVDIDVVDPETGTSTRNASNADRVATLHVYFPECDDDAGLVNLRISDRLTAKYMERALVVSDVDPAMRPRAVALAIVELLRASWLELVLQPDGDERGPSSEVRSRLVTHLKEQASDESDERKTPEERAREIDAARTTQEETARDQRWEKKRLEWVASGRIFPEGDAGDLSTTVSMSFALNRKLRLQAGGLAAGGGVNDKTTDVHTFEAAGRLGLALSGGSDPEIEILPSVEVGWARLTSPNLSVLSRPIAIGALHATIRSSVTKGVDGIIGIQAGYVLTPVEMKMKTKTATGTETQDLGGMVGPVIGVTMGLAGIL